jgi:Carboxypeptidase regulatory-like domain/TonB dependent receptor/TonB-dependent Receptor Plug Domain
MKLGGWHMKFLSPTHAGSIGQFLRRCDLRLPLLLAALVLFFTIQGLAQEATIVGTVTDPSGAAVANASITVTNLDTGLARTLTTSSDGQYVVPDLHIGRYSVRAAASGFKTTEQQNITLQVNDRARVDLKLAVGSAQEQVTVEAAAIAVQSDTGEVSDVITGQQLSQLATNGRSMYSLISLTPGASSGQGDFQIPTPVGGDANVSFNGMRESHNLYLLDGSESSDRGGAGGSDVMPSMDAIAEFRQMTSNYSAEYGLSSAATMTAVIKSGTKQYHASAWEFLRNDALDARNYFNPAPQKVAELRFHTFGFNVGGPVDFWKKEHKTFFFYNMEWRRLIQGQTLDQTVPDTAWYGGDVSGGPTPTVPTTVAPAFLAKNCNGPGPGGLPAGIVPGSPFPNNTIPTCMIDPNSTALLQAGIFPANNGLSNGQPAFLGGNNVPTNVKEEIVRIDHQFNSKFSVYGHYLREQIAQNFGTSMWSGDNVPTASNTFGNPSYSYVVHTTYVINPTLLNEVAFNENGNEIHILPSNLIARPSGFTSNRIFSGPNNDNRIPEIHLAGFNNTDYTNASWPWNNKAVDYQIRDDLSWTKGAHQLKMGASWALYKKVQDLFGNTQGSFTFNNNFTGNDFADFLLGAASGYNELAVQDSGKWNNVSWAAYVQDNWRVNNRLTLNLGLRWDGAPHTYEANNRMGNFYPNLYNPADAPIFADAAGNNIAPNSPGLGTSPNPILAGTQFYLNGIGIPGRTPGVPKGLVNDQWAAFGPRLGFAYDLTGSGKTVLRGGFGMMYERIQGNDMYNAGPNVPFSTNINFSNIELENPGTQLSNGQPLVAPITVASITGLDKVNNKLPVSYQYSVGVQHALSTRTVLELQYVGNQNRNQNAYLETNLPDLATQIPVLFANNNADYNKRVQYLGFHSIRQTENIQSSHYNGFQAQIHSQIHSDLQLQAAYTLSRAIDPATGNNGVGDLNNFDNPYDVHYDNGPSGLDRTQIAFVNFIYDIPFLKNSSNKLLKSTVGGWQVSGIVTLQTGEPVHISEGGIQNCAQGVNNDPLKCAGALNGTGNISSIIPNADNRPNVNGSVGYPKTVKSWFNASALSPTVAGTWGNLPFNSIRGPGRQNWNLALFKSFVFSETRGSRLEFRAEFFNAFNHTEFNNVSNTFTNGDFGAITSAHDPREIQLGLKAYF